LSTPSEPPITAGIADPAPLGLAAFALTTFLLSVANAGLMKNGTGDAWLGYAIAYGGLGQLLAGMWEFRNRNVFGATAFSTYGGFWIGLALWVIFVAGHQPAGSPAVGKDIAWILLAFAIFNTYMLMWSTRVSVAVFVVFATLEATEILLVIGNFMEAHGHENSGWVHWGGWVGIITAAAAWYASAAGVINGMSAPRAVLPVGKAIWAPVESPMPRGV